MKTTLPKALTNTQEIETFLLDLYRNDEFFHLDDKAEDIFNIETGAYLFTGEEAAKVNELLQQAFDICEVWELPVIRTILDNLNEQVGQVFEMNTDNNQIKPV